MNTNTLKVGDKVKTNNHSNLATIYHSMNGVITEMKTNDIMRRSKESDWTPKKIGTETVYYVSFDVREKEKSYGLWLTENFITKQSSYRIVKDDNNCAYIINEDNNKCVASIDFDSGEFIQSEFNTTITEMIEKIVSECE